MKKNNFYVTTPIYYVNSKPHLGSLYTSLLADVLARWNKILGKQTYFLTGTDEHGQKIQERAAEEKMPPQDFVDKMIPPFKDAWKKYEINYDKFIRTTDKEHEKAVGKFITQLQEQGDIYKAEYKGFYCVPDETFVNITSETQKDKDGNYLCPSCNRKLIELSEDSYFFRLSAYQDQLLKFYEENPNFITPKERMNEIVSFVKSGLRDLSMSRKSITWGIPFPGDPSHTVYVWGDALTNYISAIGFGSDNPEAKENFNKWWPADVHIMGKDIVRFHAVYWPAFLMAAKLQLPKKLLVHGFILMGDQKMSKSLGNVVDPLQLADWYGVEQIRYYLLRQMPVTQDGQFDLKEVEARIASDLAHNLSNLLHRTASLASSNDLQNVKVPEAWEASSAALRERSQEIFRIFWEEMNKCYFHVALAEVWKFIADVNAYFQSQQPWVLAKQNKEMFAEVISATCHSLYTIGILLWPVMPQKMEELLALLGHKIDFNNDYEKELRDYIWNKSFVLTKPDQPLFTPVLESHVEKVSEPVPVVDKKQGAAQDISEITIDDFSKVQLVVGTIIQCEPVKGSEKLLRSQVDMGPLGIRQILSGIAKSFKPEDLIGKQGVYVVNLAPRKMMGEMSHGMMLFAVEDETARSIMVTTEGKVANGTRLR